MSKRLAGARFAVAVGFILVSGCSPQTGMSGEALFAQYCAGCHPDGRNTINPRKTLDRKSLEANNIKTPGEIVSKMRNPGVGMPRFDRNVITDKDAVKIAEYTLSSFQK
ncbi:MAG TPA: c-type cytochrome [Geobacteraceae bacterium]|nr:c-type cytochrome [Geobacteraceae bacterium]